MNFGFDEEQEHLRQEVRNFLDRECPTSVVRRIAETERGHDEGLWKQLAELGWTGLLLPERFGGSGLGFVDAVVLLEETGRALLPAPLVPCLLAGSLLAEAGTDAQKDRWLPRIAEGSSIPALALFDDPDDPTLGGVHLEAATADGGFVLEGSKPFVHSASAADVFLVAFRTDGGASLAVLDRDTPGLSVEARPAIDGTRRHGTLHLSGVRVDTGALVGGAGGADGLIEAVADRGALATTAEIVGVAEGMHAMTVQYAKDRIQFGSPIGRYQGVKHPLAEAYVQIECVKSLLYYAAWAIDEGADDVPLAVSRAKGLASEAVRDIGVMGIQLHGAVGYTAEYDVHLFLRRSKWARPAFGDENHHYERIARLGGL